MKPKSDPVSKPSDGTPFTLKRQQCIHSQSEPEHHYIVMDNANVMTAGDMPTDQAPNQVVSQPNTPPNDTDKNEQLVDAQDAVQGQENNEMKVEYLVDFNVFRKIECDDHCNGKHGYCKAVERIIAALDYHQFLVNGGLDAKYGDDSVAAFTAFCEEVYPKTAMLNDYIHFVTHHADAEGLEYIRGRLQFPCESAAKCGATSRHYRDRRNDIHQGPDDKTTNWFIDRIDSIHFMVHHLHELGLRVSMETIQNELSVNDEIEDKSILVDRGLERMAQEIESKRALLSSERLDGFENSKFTMLISQQNHENGKNTKMDEVLLLIWKHNKSESKQRSFFEFAVENDIDTDCIEDDSALFEEVNNSILYNALNGDNEAMESVRTFFRHHKIMGKSFSTGFPLFYWKWYDKATDEDVKGSYWVCNKFDFGGRPIQDFVVHPRFGNIKEEVMATGLLSSAQFEQLVVQKAAQYLKTRKCRKTKCTFFNRETDPLHFGIKKGSPIQPHHLYAIILYCDFTKFCTLFSLSLRETNHGDGLKEVKGKNRAFFYVSKYLRELVTYFGSDGGYFGGRMNGVVKGPFFSGVSTVMNLGEFRMGFNTPTSTSKSKEIAWRFAGPGGMVIAVGNQKDVNSKLQPVFNATWISAFVEEDEYLWYGSIWGVNVEDVVIVASSRAYRHSVSALDLFDAVLSGQYMSGQKVEETQSEILDFCIKTALNENVLLKPVAVDQYVLDNFYCFQQSKKQIRLRPFWMNNNDEYLKNLIFYGLSNSSKVPDDNTNIFRPILFKLFPNLVELVLWDDSEHALNLLSLLSVLEEALIPQSFEVMKVHDQYGKWMKSAFAAIPDIRKQYDDKNWDIEMDKKGKWIFIKKQS